jgi:hypothetical protein
VLAHGVEHKAAGYKGRRMEIKQCFKNATQLVLDRDELTYAEGFAISGDMLRIGMLFPVHHAWAVDAEGIVHDPTFKDAQHGVYLGVPVDKEVLVTTMLRTRVYGVFVPNEMLNEVYFAAFLKEIVG